MTTGVELRIRDHLIPLVIQAIWAINGEAVFHNAHLIDMIKYHTTYVLLTHVNMRSTQ